MDHKNFTATLEVVQPPTQVFRALSDVSNWWSKDFQGHSAKLGDEFIIDHPGRHYSKQQLVEVIPGAKMVWLVTESQLNWLQKNREEWTGTKMIFDITGSANKTLLHFTHEGLTVDKECYSLCEKGWSIIINDWLFHLITTGRPSADMARAAEIRDRYLAEKENPETNDYHRTFTVNVPAAEAMKKISQVNGWWKKDFSGRADREKDTFTVPFGEPSFVDFVVSELVAGKRMVWKVTDCYLPWFQDKKEWNSTAIVFELSEENGRTRIDFTHRGLVPEMECYQACENGWNGHIHSLEKFINDSIEIT